MPKNYVSRFMHLLVLRGACLCMLSVMLSSCASSVGLGRGNSSFVSVEINNSSRAKVNAAVISVFREEGFSLVSQGPYGIHFRKLGGGSAKLIYGSWLSEGVSAEPEIIIADLGGGNYGVYCDVYMREHSGSELLDANWKVVASGKRAYQKLMKRIKERSEN